MLQSSISWIHHGLDHHCHLVYYTSFLTGVPASSWVFLRLICHTAASVIFVTFESDYPTLLLKTFPLSIFLKYKLCNMACIYIYIYNLQIRHPFNSPAFLLSPLYSQLQLYSCWNCSCAELCLREVGDPVHFSPQFLILRPYFLPQPTLKQKQKFKETDNLRVRWSFCLRDSREDGHGELKMGVLWCYRWPGSRVEGVQRTFPSLHPGAWPVANRCSTVLNRASIPCVGRGAWSVNFAPPPSCPQTTCNEVHLLPWLHLYFELISLSFSYFCLFLILPISVVKIISSGRCASFLWHNLP